MNHTNTSSTSSLISSQTNSGGLTGYYSIKTNPCSIKTTETDHNWQLFQGTGNQIDRCPFF